MTQTAPERIHPDLVLDTTLLTLEIETEEQLWAIILPTATAQGATGATLRQVAQGSER